MPKIRTSRDEALHTKQLADKEDTAALTTFSAEASRRTTPHLSGSGQSDARNGPDRQLGEGSKGNRSHNELTAGVTNNMRQMALDDGRRALRRVPRNDAQRYTQYTPETNPSRAEGAATSAMAPVGQAHEATGSLEDQAGDYLSRIRHALGEDFEPQVNFGADQRQRVVIKNIVVGASERAAKWQQQHLIVNRLRDLATMVATLPGRTIISDLIRLKVTLVLVEEVSGSDQITHTDAKLTQVSLRAVRRPSWASPDPTPPDVKMFDLLSVAASQIGLCENDRVIYPNGLRMHAAAAEQAGVGPYADNPTSGNAYREARGLPRQTFVSSSDEIGSNGLWGSGASLDQLFQVPSHIQSSNETSSEQKEHIHNLAFKLSQVLGLDEPVVHVDAATHATLSVHLGNTTFRANGLARDSHGDQLSWLEGIFITYDKIAQSKVGQSLLPENFKGPCPVIVGNRIPGMGETRVNVRGGVIYVSLPNIRERKLFDTVHENVHVRTFQRIAALGQDLESPNEIFVKVNTLTIVEDELRATGLGPFENDEVSENAYRDEVGHPRRRFYGGEEELQNGIDYGPVSDPFISSRESNSYGQGA